MAKQNERAVIDLVINGEQSKSSLRDITAAAVDARKQLNRMAETDPGYAKQKRELEALLRVQSERTVKIKQEISAWSKWKAEAGTILTGVLGGNIATAGIEALISFIPSAIEKSIKLKDELADVAKAADMMDSEVVALKRDLKDMDTRTATKDLMAMAEVGGQFGVAKNELEGFVDGMNKVNVAIGKDFGGVENLTKEIMPLRNIFTNIKSLKIDQDILHIGNALNVLEADGAATSPVMADFASRMGGVLVPLGLAEGKVLGLSATLQELNVTAERGSTATVNIFQKMLTETSTFAKVAGVPLKEYRDLINKDMYDAFMKYLEGLKRVSGSQTDFMAVLEKSKLTGAGEMEVLSKLVVNTQMLTDKTNQATVALTGTDSIMGEYNKKNYELAINMKKLTEWFGSLMSNLSPVAEGIVNLTVKLLGLNDETGRSSQKFEEQRSKVAALEKNINPLLKRYDELIKISKPTRKEQDELKTVIQSIATALPTAVSGFDKYGNAIAISTEKAREAIQIQRELLKYTNKQAIAETDTELTNLRYQQQQLAKKRMSGKEVTVGMNNAGTVTERQLTDAELRQLDAQIRKKQEEIRAAELRRQGLSGDNLEAPKPPKPVAPVKPPAGGGVDLGESKEEKRDRLERERADRKRKQEEKAVERHEDQLENLMEDARQRTARLEKDEYEKEQLQFGEHYAKLFDLAKGNKEKMTEITTLMYQELDVINERERVRQEEKARKLLEEDNKLGFDAAMNAADQARADAQGGIDPQAGFAGESDIRMQELQADELYLSQKLLLEQTFAQESAETQRQLTENNNAQVRLRAETERQYADQMRQAEQGLQDAKRSAMEQGIGVLKGFLKQGTIAYKAAIVGQKAFAIAQVVVDMNREIAQIYANPTWSLLPDGGLTLKTANATAAKVRAGISIASIAATGIGELAQKDDGGFTGVRDLYGSAQGFVDKPTRVNAGRRSYLVGEQRPEWIMGGAMLASPFGADIAGMLESLQRTGGFRNVSAGAGRRDQPGQPQQAGGGFDVALLVAEVRALRADVQGQAERPINYNYFEVEKTTQRVAEIKVDTKL